MKIIQRAWPLFLMLILSACAQGPGGGFISGDDSSSGIVGGQIEKENSPLAASVVMIATQDENGNSINCTGTFIGKNWILTAAHCVNKDPALMSLFFSIDPYADANSPMLTADAVAIHENALVSDKVRNDMAMIHFVGDLPKGARIALLPDAPVKGSISTTASTSASTSPLQFQAVGYGRTDGLEHDATEMVGSGVLRSVPLRSLDANTDKPNFSIDQTTGHGVCFGDSGGPAMVVKSALVVKIIGVASGVYGDGQDSCKQHSMYMKVSSYLDWIQSQMKTSLVVTTASTK